MKENLVILGGGFAGVHTLESLPSWVKRQYNVILIDQNDHFLFTPLLHEVATNILAAADVTRPFNNLIGSDVQFIQAKVTNINYQQKIISLDGHEPVAYSMVVMGLGAQTNYFNTKGAEEYTMVLKNLAGALEIKEKLTTASQPVSLLVIGGGPTGVELVSEAVDFLKKNALNHSVTLVNGGDSLLKALSPVSQRYAQKVLEQKGVVVLNNTRVTEVTETGVVTAEGEHITASLMVWAAGVMPQVVDGEPEVKHYRNRLSVSNTLQLSDYPEVFVLGDMAFAPTEDQRGYPMLAQVAKQQGVHTAQNIVRLVKGKTLKPFVFKQRGSLASLGRGHAIVEMKNVVVHRFIAWVLWKAIYLVTFNSWRNRFTILKRYLKQPGS
jgi:NADH dehydrogenase